MTKEEKKKILEVRLHNLMENRGKKNLDCPGVVKKLKRQLKKYN